MVKICVNGRLKIKKKSDVPTLWPKAGGGTYEHLFYFHKLHLYQNGCKSYGVSITKVLKYLGNIMEREGNPQL